MHDWARLQEGCQDIVDLLGIPGGEDPRTDMFRLLCAWIRDSKDDWALILDNFDGYHFLGESLHLVWTYLQT